MVEAYRDGEVVRFECLECDRRVVLYFADQRMLVVTQGDFGASHSGGVLPPGGVAVGQ
jgi:hypothetical protein